MGNNCSIDVELMSRDLELAGSNSTISLVRLRLFNSIDQLQVVVR